MEDFDKQDRIDAYLRREVAAEESFARAVEPDPYTRLVYRRGRELYWTLERVVKKIHALFAPPAPAPLFEFAAGRPQEGDGPRIFIDATDLLFGRKATGIQRVVREISRHAAEGGLGLPVAVENGRLVAACRFPGAPETIEVAAGDILLLLDAGWNRLDCYPQLIEDFRARGGKVVVCLYDLFPLLYPALYTRGLVADFRVWMNRVILRADAVVAISRSVAESFRDYARRSGRPAREGLRLGWWPLGADIAGENGGDASEEIAALAARAPFFLAVGTLEMRKGYPVALAAFERLWAKGVEANFVIVGRAGWNAGALEDRLWRHPQKGRRLFWLDNASDADLAHLYGAARGVVLATFAEGFGLPLVEAAQFGAPVIASDIDVFHEVGGAGVAYFDLLDSESLAARLEAALAGETVAAPVAHVDWAESTRLLMAMLRSGDYPSALA
jgi:alpha-1,2-rhamnosyltransferase